MSFFSNLLKRFKRRPLDLQKVEAYAKELRLKARPCLRIEVKQRGGVSRLGGVPSFSPGRAWPQWNGAPLGFLAKLDLAEIRDGRGPDWLPARGLLNFFYNVEQLTDGCRQEDAGSWAVLFEPDPENTAPVAEPADLPAIKGKASRYSPHPIRLKRYLTYPGWEKVGIDNPRERRAAESRINAAWLDDPDHRIGGYPGNIQSELMEINCELLSQGLPLDTPDDSVEGRTAAVAAEDWRLLLQIASDNAAGIEWFEGGTLYFWVREQDARAGDFEKTWIQLQYT